jgi:glycosyltransferase involved in cell wall biosynthesis
MFLLPTLDMGGAERIAVRTAANLDRRRFRTSILAFRRGTGRATTPLGGTDVLVDVLQSGAESRLVAPLKLWRYLRRNRPDVLMTFMFHANTAGRLVGRLAGVPAIVSSERVVGWEGRWRIVLNRWTLSLAQVVTTNSEQGRRFWAEQLGCPPQAIEVIYNGVDTAEFFPANGSASRDVRLGVLARLHRANGHDWLLDGLAALRARAAQGWVCLLAGEGPEDARLRAKAARLGLEKMVQFVGHAGDAAAFLRTLDVYVHPALVAGMPNAVLESMACALPVVATGVGGTPEAVVHGETGWLLDAGDTAGFVQRVESLISDVAVREQMGRAGRDRVLHLFSLDAMIRRTEDVLERVLLQSGSRAQST